MITELAIRFAELAEQWEAHCAANRVSSNPYVYLRHPSFEGIVALGEAAVPLIVDRYRDGSVFWGAALRQITGISQFGDGVVGNLEATRRGWLQWWEQQRGPSIASR